MTINEVGIIEAFRDLLPECPNRDMWVNETLLEYKRLHLLRLSGELLHPAPGSLLETMISLEPNQLSNVTTDPEFVAYKKRFGQEPTYCWTVPLSKLVQELGSGPVPAVAWVRGDA
jgi:hypothetical protein